MRSGRPGCPAENGHPTLPFALPVPQPVISNRLPASTRRVPPRRWSRRTPGPGTDRRPGRPADRMALLPGPGTAPSLSRPAQRPGADPPTRRPAHRTRASRPPLPHQRRQPSCRSAATSRYNHLPASGPAGRRICTAPPNCGYRKPALLLRPGAVTPVRGLTAWCRGIRAEPVLNLTGPAADQPARGPDLRLATAKDGIHRGELI
jgi:hypothetical protein